VGGAHSIHRRETYSYKVLVGKPEGENLEDLGVDGRILKLDLEKIGMDGVVWIHVARDRDMWRTLVKKVMKLLFP
jgi:hypothetical protein